MKENVKSRDKTWCLILFIRIWRHKSQKMFSFSIKNFQSNELFDTCLWYFWKFGKNTFEWERNFEKNLVFASFHPIFSLKTVLSSQYIGEWKWGVSDIASEKMSRPLPYRYWNKSGYKKVCRSFHMPTTYPRTGCSYQASTNARRYNLFLCKQLTNNINKNVKQWPQ